MQNSLFNINNVPERLRQEQILKIILIGSIIFLTLLNISVIYHTITLGDAYKGISIVKFTILTLFFYFLFFIPRKKYYYFLSVVVVFIYLGATMFASIHWGVDLQVALLSYAFLIIISSMLVGTKFSLFICGTVSIFNIRLWHLQITNQSQPDWYWKSHPIHSDVLVFTFLLILIGLISWLYNREIDHSLQRAYTSEKELLAERDSLEIKVSERAKDIERLQMDQMITLHQRAESGRMVSGFFHDLMNSLTAVALVMEYVDPNQSIIQARSQLRKAITASKQMSNFVSIIKKYNPTTRLENSTFSWTAEIKNMKTLLAYQLQKANVILKIHFAGKDKGRGDFITLYQVLNIYLNNTLEAYDFMDTKNKLIELSICTEESGATIIIKSCTEIFNDKTLPLTIAQEVIQRKLNGSVNIYNDTEKSENAIVILLPTFKAF